MKLLNWILKGKENSDIDSCVHAVAKLVGHLGVPEYGHGCKTFQEFLEIKTRNLQLQQRNSTVKQPKTVKLARQVGSRYHVTDLMMLVKSKDLDKSEHGSIMRTHLTK